MLFYKWWERRLPLIWWIVAGLSSPVVINVCSHPMGRFKAMQLSLVPAQLRIMPISPMTQAATTSVLKHHLNCTVGRSGEVCTSHVCCYSSQPENARLLLVPPAPPIPPTSWWARLLSKATNRHHCMWPCTRKCPKWCPYISSCSQWNIFMTSRIT